MNNKDFLSGKIPQEVIDQVKRTMLKEITPEQARRAMTARDKRPKRLK